MEDLIENYNTQYEKKKLGMWLDLSTYCNAKCPQCHRTNANGLQKADWLPLIQWSFEDFKKMFPIKTMHHINHFDICGTWGDPIMNKDIFEIVKYIMNNSRATVLINTNGSFRNADWWWELGLLGRERIIVMWAVEGITQEQHSLYRQDTNLDLILEHIETFSAAGGVSKIFTVTFKHNENDLYNIAKMTRDLGAIEIFFAPSNRFYDNNKFDFIDKEGNAKALYRTTKETSDFYWKIFKLNNEEDMRLIYEESTRD